MINDKKVLAIIPARAGSKRVKDKNIRELGGKPLITWTIEAAKASQYIDHTFVSTDSEIIQSIAKEYGVDAEPLRPAELATDTASSVDVVLDVLNRKSDFDLIVLLQPTSPLRNHRHIDEAIELFVNKNANSVTSVCEAEVHPSWCAPVGEDLLIEQLVKNVQVKRSQDLETNYRLNGAIYIVDSETLSKDNSFFAKENAYAYKMARIDSVDIDTEEDFKLAFCLFQNIHEEV